MAESKRCQRLVCSSDRILTIGARAKDMHWYEIHGDVADQCYGIHIFKGDGDTTIFDVCLECGQVQGKFPEPPMFMEPDYADTD
jgi:hypothetical protein